jgi:uncharacterized membrane protein
MSTTVDPVVESGSTQPAVGPGRGRSRRRAVRIGFVLFALFCVSQAVFAPLPYFTHTMAELSDADVGLAAHYAHQPQAVQVTLMIHAASSGIALLLTPVQWAARFRRRWPATHRVVGQVVAAAVLVGAASGLVVAQFSYAGVVGAVGFSAAAVVWAGSCWQLVRAARAHDRAAHRRWAARTTALTFAGVTLRTWTPLAVVLQHPSSDEAFRQAFDRAYHWMPFLAWVPNLVVAEWALRRRAGRLSGLAAHEPHAESVGGPVTAR